MFLLKSLIGMPGHYAAMARVRGPSHGKRRPRPLFFERLESRLCLSPWSDPVNLGPVINGPGLDNRRPAISSDGLSLYFSSNRPGGGLPDTGPIWVSQRASVNDPWGEPQKLGPAINDPDSVLTSAPNLSTDQHWLFFFQNRVGGSGMDDNWASYRPDTHDDFGWQTPINLGPGVNTPYADAGPAYFEDPATGITTLYFNSNRPGLGDYDIYASTLQGFGKFGPAVLVPELSSAYRDTRMAIRNDGLEIFVTSNRPGGLGSGLNIWVSTRASTLDRWSTPVNLGAPINMAGFNDGAPALSADGNTMYFYANRPGSLGVNDLWMSTRLDHIALTASASTTAGHTFPVTLTAWGHDGNIDTGYTGTVSFASSDSHATLPASYTFTAADNGAHAFGAALLTAGAQSVTATDTTAGIPSAQAGIVVNPAPADHFLIAAPPTAVSGMAFDVTVTARDPYGNVDTNYIGTATWMSSDTDSGVVLPADYAFQTSDDGTHTFSAAVTLITPGDQSLTATDTASAITGSATVTVTPGPQAPPGGGARHVRMPRLGVQADRELASVDRLFTSLKQANAGLLFARRGHDGAANELFSVEEGVLA
jgi:hypothetical protein